MNSTPAPRRTRIVVLTGAPGAGKTETGRRLVRRYRVPAALIDTDAVADIHPWQAGERLYEVLDRNLRTCLDSYRAWGARVVVISGVMLPGRNLERFADLLADPTTEWVFYGLRAAPAQLAVRIRADTKVQEADERLTWAHLDEELASVPAIRLVDTNPLTLEEVVDRITEYEASDLPPGAVATSPRVVRARVSVDRDMVRVTLKEAAAVAGAALKRVGFPRRAASDTVGDLMEAEIAGAPSHGLLRIPEYVAAVEAGHLVPTAVPMTRSTGPGSHLLDGRRAPGAVVRRRLEALLTSAGADRPAVVGLRDAGHLGRLSGLARGVAAANLVLIGFVNYSGAGRKVAPTGGTAGVWGTNPVVFGCPAPPGPPVIVDMSTSAVSEGTVRAALLSGQAVPPGVLIDRQGRAATDPRLLYTTPARAALLPAAGHKGHAWAAFTEVLAGVVAGAGHAADPRLPGNGGLFIAFPADALGNSTATLGAAVHRLEEHLRDLGTVPGEPPPRLPGRANPRPEPVDLSIPTNLWNQLLALSSASPPPAPLRSTTEGAMV
ncbi:Ldh family oxidoreductase [Streptomyces sp. TG1A-8]|uniref:Ldh family oxidoreductase n=1 Tax=Streptomyces sp. TG1A-8 TaxID=3051385 RepID=UPI00265C0C3E|nr:Ldh family oxidoreductase [Streptomyces sp. TG1A-8]MDO0925007.1 Ldh family oxidoreductase [Streptomyces sp. TG1A-8]